jgi:hypothetical protein
VEKFRKQNNKEKMTICDGVRDHIIPHMTGKDYEFDMWEFLCKIYQSPNQNWKIVLQDNLRCIQMLNSESVTSFLGIFTQIRDDIASIREIVDPEFMVRTTLKNFTKPRGLFV